MKKSLVASALISLNAISFIHARDIPDTDLALGIAGVAAASWAGLMAIEHGILPLITGRRENSQRRNAYEQGDAIRHKYEQQTMINDKSPNLLKRRIQEIKEDKARLEGLLETVPFNNKKEGQGDAPLRAVIGALDARLHLMEKQYVSSYLTQACSQYGQEITLMHEGNLTKSTAEDRVNETCGSEMFRHQTYIDRLARDVLLCHALLEQLGPDTITVADQKKIDTLQTLLQTVTRLLTPELQNELQVRAQTEQRNELHKAELTKKREETACYRRCKKVCEDLQAAVNIHGAMVGEVKRTVGEVKEAISQDRQWEQFLHRLDQAGSERRIVDAIRQLLAQQESQNRSLVQKLRTDLQILKERMQGSQGQSYTPPPDPYYPPPPMNPEYQPSAPID